MTDLELMKVLEESGFEPSVENLIALKESIRTKKIEVIEESFKDTVKKGWGKIKEKTGLFPEGDAYEEQKKFVEEKKAKGEDTSSAEKSLNMLKPKDKNLRESSYSDYELYKILDENGYTTTNKNLAILKEGLSTGRFTIEE